MSSGKLSSQAGHAFCDSLKNAEEIKPELVSNYRNDGLGGSKITLEAKNETQLIRAYNEALIAGIPCSVIVDRNHIMPPYFNGEPIITAVGIGPCTQKEARHITKRYQCVK